MSIQKKSNNLAELFTTISNNPSVTDNEISEKIKNRKLLSRLNQNKYELYQAILDGLHRFDLRKSPYARILTMLHQSEILLHKGLMRARMDLLIKAEALADEYELIDIKSEILRLQYSRVADAGKYLNARKHLAGKIISHSQLAHLQKRANVFFNKMGERPTLSQKNTLIKYLNVLKGKLVIGTHFMQNIFPSISTCSITDIWISPVKLIDTA